MQHLVPPPQNVSLNAKTALAQGMVHVELQAGASFTFSVVGSEIEDGCCPPWYSGGYYNNMGIDVQYPWEGAPGRQHSHVFTHAELPPFWIDVHLVTNEQYQEFAKASKYEPADDGNYLKHWVPAQTSSTLQHPPPRQPAVGTETQPVRWVSLDDARAYCAWRGARLPTEFEWQLAGQGADVQAGRPARRFPWGG